MKSILERESYIVDVASGGQEALDYIQHTIPDGIILDLMMPEVDGFEVLEKIRSTMSTKNIPVLILTAKDLTRKDLSKLSANNIQQLIHKGDVDIEGLIFRVKLMVKGREDVRTRGSEYLNPMTQEIIRTKEAQKMEGNLSNILVVEDNADNMTTIKAILKGKYNITEASDGEEGLKMAQSQLPDMILLDMSLPKMDGEQIAGILKENTETKNIPVIAITARVMIGDKEKFLEAGCDDFVEKPIDAEELNRKIEKFLIK